MQVFRNLSIFFCVFGVVQSTDFNFWLGVPTQVEIPKYDKFQNPVQIYTCMANLLCELGRDAPNLLKECDSLATSDDKTVQNNGWPFWKIPDYRNYGCGNLNNIYGNVESNAGNMGSNFGKIGSNFGKIGSSDGKGDSNYGNVKGIYENVIDCIPNWKKGTVAPNIEENDEFEDARQELCEMLPKFQYYFIRDKYTEALEINLNSTDQAVNPTFECVVSLLFDLSMKGKCGDRWIYPRNPLWERTHEDQQGFPSSLRK